MTAFEVHEMSRVLGEIGARLKVIEDNQKDERISSSQHRSDLRITIASQATATLGLAAKLENVVQDVAEMRTLTNDYRENRDQARGATKVILIFRTIAVAAASGVVGLVSWLIHHQISVH